ncbi:MAG: efflux RND transporter periplasmic adaptor subunit [Candidatus Hydrogenedentota bacterium]|nr:MAG: efflux RND transporter periplasmic adaptor subunit [Candidatus Hydrogenedentota bacterium]
MKHDLSALSIDPEARNKRGPGKKIIWTAAGILIIAAAGISWITAVRRVPEVEVAAVKDARTGGGAILNASGYVTPRRRATVSAKITGKIEEVLIEEGMEVKKGQVLARLDTADALAALRAVEAEHGVALAALAQLEVELANARRTLERNIELRKRNLNSQEDLDNAETAAASLEAQLALAEQRVTAAGRGVAIAQRNLENCTVRAPFAGVVVSKDAQPGEMISPVSAGGGFTRTGIATIVDMESLEIEVDVNESYIARVSPGQRVEAILDAYPNWRIPGSVRTVIPTADRQKATVKVRISFDELDPRILPDMGIKVAFLERKPDGEPAAKALAPEEAIREDNGATFAYVVKDGRIERRSIKTGQRRAGEVEILAGLRGGEMVVVGGEHRLRDGMKVKVVD